MLRLHLYINKLTNSDVTALIPTTSFLCHSHINILASVGSMSMSIRNF